MPGTLKGLLALVLLIATALPTIPVGAQHSDYQVVGGRPADPGEYPGMAAVLIDGQQSCGGTLVDPGWVITAAHCFYDGRTGGSGVAPDQVEVLLDTVDLRSGGERVGVGEIVLHPDYEELRTVNDIALLRLTAPAAAAPAPIVAADAAALYTAGTPAVVTGWGATTPDGNDSSPILLEADLPLVDDPSCDEAYGGGIVADRHTCAGDPGTVEQPGPDSCQGDSGGPLWTDRGDGVLVQIGITSFGILCGVDVPGVYTELITYLRWIAGTLDGSIPTDSPTDPTTPPLPDPPPAQPLRIDAGPTSDPVDVAVAVSQQVFFDGGAEYGVVATSGAFPDALGGASLAYGVAPLLFTGVDGGLPAATATELQRTVQPGGDVYVLGGVAAVPAQVDDELTALGFRPVRLAGSGREATAVAVADEIAALFGGNLPQDTVIVATGADWPDAVTVGQIGSWWGFPVLLTPADRLDPGTAAALQRLAPERVLVPGGEAAVDAATFEAIAVASGARAIVRLGGPTRVETAAAITDYNRQSLFGGLDPEVITVVNLRRPADAFAHVLAGSMVTGGLPGVFAVVEGDGGTIAPQPTLDSVCGMDRPVVVVGGTDLVADAAAAQVQAAANGDGCDPTLRLDLGDAVRTTTSSALPTRDVLVDGQAGQQVRIRVDALPEVSALDPIVELRDPDGALVGVNDDGSEGTTDAFLETELPVDGTYTVTVLGFGGSIGPFQVSVDPAPIVTDVGELTAAQPEVGYPLTAEPGTRVVVEMRRPDVADPTDPLLRAVGPDGTLLAEDDDGGVFPHARLSFTHPGGTVTVVATVFADAYGPYILAVMAPEGGVTAG